MELIIFILCLVNVGLQFCVLAVIKKLVEVLIKPLKQFEQVGNLFGDFNKNESMKGD